MHKKIIIFFFIIVNIFIFSKESNVNFSGSYESLMDFIHARNYANIFPNYGKFNWGWNNYSNIRIDTDIGEYLSFGFSFNLNIYAGTYSVSTVNTLKASLNNLSSLSFVLNSMTLGSIEIERLYFKGGNDYFDIETGLIRVAYGYGYTFSPIDFFNPVDPLNPDARKKGKLAILATFYPADMWMIKFFAVAPENPVEQEGWGFKFGASTNFSINKFNFEFLYTFYMPEIEYQTKSNDFPEYMNDDFSHVFGFSFKADIEIGLIIEMIYRFDHRVFSSKEYYGKTFYGYEGLEAGIGIDYTIAGRVYLLLEYMFYGSGMLDWGDRSLDSIYNGDWENTNPEGRTLNPEKKPLNYLRHDYIIGMINVKVNDYVHIGTSYLFGADDQSGILTGFIEIEPVQAFTIKISAMFPFDWRMIDNSWQAGEFGSKNLGFYQNYKLTLKVKF